MHMHYVMQAAHTADLLRTRLTVEAQQQNIRELEQLQQNSRTQLLLQAARRDAPPCVRVACTRTCTRTCTCTCTCTCGT